jgi:hypothetical protein
MTGASPTAVALPARAAERDVDRGRRRGAVAAERLLYLATASMALSTLPLVAQEPPRGAPADSICELSGALPVDGLGTRTADFDRLLDLSGVSPARPRMILRGGFDQGPLLCAASLPGSWRPRLRDADTRAWRLLPLQQTAVFQSSLPIDRNNGALWSGRGLSTETSGGFAIHSGPLSAAIAPVVAFVQNRGFETLPVTRAGSSPFADPWTGSIDLPQRLGDEAFWIFHPGQSYVRLRAAGASAGVSTENLWWGPGIRNSILLSNTAPGFPHAFLGTASPINIGIGRLEAQAVWGLLHESDYFDGDEANDRRQFSGFVADFEPRWLPGLYLGAARIFEYRGAEFSAERLLPFLQPFRKEQLATPENPLGSDPDNQLVALYWRWVLPASHFETYGEWAREDHSWNFDDFFLEPDHSQAYSLGFQKLVPSGERWIYFGGELTHLQERPIDRVGRSTPTFYYNSGVRHGYTHRGQLLGAWIGPGADSQHLRVGLHGQRNSLGLTLERVRRRDDVYYRVLRGVRWDHDAEGTVGIDQLIGWQDLDIGWKLAYTFRRNRNFADNAQNLGAEVSATWRPGPEPRRESRDSHAGQAR